MAIFGQYQGGDPFQVGPNMQNYIAGERNVQTALIEGIDKFNQSLQEMDTLRSTTGSILSQFPTDETGKPSPAAPKYVHDLYKSVEKEGGIQGLSKSSLISALKGYETGFQVEAQQMQIRAAQQAETLKGYEIEKAKREADEARKIALAHRLAMESLETPSGRTETATAPTLAYDMPADMGNEIYKYYTGQRSTDPRQAPAKPQVAQPTPTSTIAKPSAKKPAGQSKTLEQKVNPETAERDALELKLNQLGAGDSINRLKVELEEIEKELAIAQGVRPYNSYITVAGIPMGPREKNLDEIKADKEREKVLVPRITSLKKQIAELQVIADKPLPEAKPKPAGATPTPAPASSVTNPSAEEVYRIGSNFLKNNPPSKWANRLEVLREEVSKMETMFGFDRENKTQVFYNADYEETERPEYNDFVKIATELTELEAVKAKYDTFKSIPNIDKPYVAPKPKDEINPAFLPTAVPESVAPKATSKPISKARPTVKPSSTTRQQPQIVNSNPALKSDDEKITEEYGQLTSRLKALGSIPLNWSEDTYRQMRGYAPKIKVVQQGGFALVGIGDKWQAIKTGGENQMSPSELAIHEKHLILKEAIRTDKMTNNKWTFKGDIRTTEAQTAGMVKKSTLDTTRALDALDKLIEAGSNTGFWDSITPTEKSGLIEGVTNSVQAAGRTEVAGSGAFSEEDARKLERIVPNLASLTGAVFKEQTLSKLKTYRERMAQQVKDLGRVWGFEVSEATDTGLTPEQQAIMRSVYQEAIKQGNSHEDAKRIAKESLSQ